MWTKHTKYVSWSSVMSAMRSDVSQLRPSSVFHHRVQSSGVPES